MKHCAYCGMKFGDEVDVCPTDRQRLQPFVELQTPGTPGSVPAEAARGDVISPAEQRFWERMTFRQFGLVMIRLQALWLLFYVVMDLTYLPESIRRLSGLSPLSGMASGFKREFFWMIFRTALHAAAALALILYGEKILSWLVMDWVSKQPRDTNEKGSSGPQEQGP